MAIHVFAARNKEDVGGRPEPVPGWANPGPWAGHDTGSRNPPACHAIHALSAFRPIHRAPVHRAPVHRAPPWGDADARLCRSSIRYVLSAKVWRKATGGAVPAAGHWVRQSQRTEVMALRFLAHASGVDAGSIGLDLP
jgi:hypothetical protein